MELARKLMAMAVAGTMMVGATSAQAIELLNDDFNDGSLATNPGTGSGFTLFQGFGAGGTAVESGGTVNVKGNGTNIVTHIQSNDTFDPTGLTLTWQVNGFVDAPGFNGAGLGWVAPGSTPGGGVPAVELELRNDRLTLDFLDGAGNFTRQVGIAIGSLAADATYDWDFTSPVTVTLALDATSWSLNATGTGVSVNQSGLYTGFGAGGAQIVGATPVTLGMILAQAGSNLATYGSAMREPGNATFDYVTITAVPEPASLALLGLGGLLILRRKH